MTNEGIPYKSILHLARQRVRPTDHEVAAKRNVNADLAGYGFLLLGRRRHSFEIWSIKKEKNDKKGFHIIIYNLPY